MATVFDSGLLSLDLVPLSNLAPKTPLERRPGLFSDRSPIPQVLKGHIGLDTVIFPTGTTGKPRRHITALNLVSHQSHLPFSSIMFQRYGNRRGQNLETAILDGKHSCVVYRLTLCSPLDVFSG